MATEYTYNSELYRFRTVGYVTVGMGYVTVGMGAETSISTVVHESLLMCDGG